MDRDAADATAAADDDGRDDNPHHHAYDPHHSAVYLSSCILACWMLSPFTASLPVCVLLRSIVSPLSPGCLCNCELLLNHLVPPISNLDFF